MMKVSIVNYLNTSPFLWGIRNSGLLAHDNFQISLDVPSESAYKLLSGEVELGLVPVAILPLIKNYHIHGSTCIGADGKVDSVTLLSEVPLHKIEVIEMDNQSRTSVNLCRLLARDYWKINPRFESFSSKDLKNVSGTRATVLIGDRVFDYASKFAHVYDLSDAWKQWTGLPFVFAVWASKKELNNAQIEKFEEALHFGLLHKDEAIQEALVRYPEHYPVENYLNHRISYNLDTLKKLALETFLTKLSTLSSMVF